MKQHLKPFLIGIFTATTLSAVAILLIYKWLETDFDYRLASAKKIEVRIPQDHIQAYQEGFMYCLRNLNMNVYSAYLRCFIEYGVEPISDAQLQVIADYYKLEEFQTEFLKSLVSIPSSKDTLSN